MVDDDWVCGENWDHELRLISESDGMRVLWCENCGAEIWEEDE